MQLASSIRYGRLLVKATDCNYTDYKNLGLVCPNCHESVFLTKGHDRHYKSSKTSVVAAHFNHRQDKSAQAIALCELRVKQISAAEIKRRENASRNQRLQLFNRHLWNILTMCYKLEDSTQERQRLVEKGFVKVCPDERAATQIKKGYISLICKTLVDQSDRINSEADYFISSLRSKVTEEKLILHEHLKPLLSIWGQTIDRKMQVEIYKEVVAALVQKKHLPILEKLVEISLYNFVIVTALSVESNLKDEQRLQMFNSFFAGNIHVNEQTTIGVFQALVETYATQDKERMSAVYNFVRDDVLETIALTPWAEGFEKYAEA